MATVGGRLVLGQLVKIKNTCTPQKLPFSTFRNLSTGKKALWTTSGIAIIGTTGLIYALNESVKADDHIHPMKLPWNHRGWLETFDHQSIRRGYEVYKQVCAACHGMKYLRYRELINVCHTEEEARAEAAEASIVDGPNEEGDMFKRPGKLFDSIPSPYENDEKARVANSGALPPDLSLITSARHGGEDYVFALLTGYCDAPAGIELREGLHYNPYFPGGAIGMAQALYSEIIEYSDGTPATMSQLAKDVSVFLKWVAEPEHDKKKLIWLKSMVILSLLLAVSVYYKRLKWAPIKTRKIVFKKPK